MSLELRSSIGDSLAGWLDGALTSKNPVEELRRLSLALEEERRLGSIALHDQLASDHQIFTHNGRYSGYAAMLHGLTPFAEQLQAKQNAQVIPSAEGPILTLVHSVPEVEVAEDLPSVPMGVPHAV